VSRSPADFEILSLLKRDTCHLYDRLSLVIAVAGFYQFSLPQRRPIGRSGKISRVQPLAILLCAGAVFLLAANDAGAMVPRSLEDEIFEGVFYRPAGSRVTFVWQAVNLTDRGEWCIYRGHDPETFEFVDLTPARRGESSYRYEVPRPLLGREFFQLRYRDQDGTETVLVQVLLVGTEFTVGLPSLPDGPSPAMFMASPGWEPPGSTFDLDSLFGVVPLGSRPKPDVPPPKTVC